jgi:uncharacterized protein
MGPAEQISEPLVLYLDEIEEGHVGYAWSVGIDELEAMDEQYSFPNVVQVNVNVERSLQTFHVKAKMHCDLNGECCRCLEMAQASTTALLEMLFQRKEASPEELEAMKEDEDVVILDPGTRQVNLKEYLRQALVLEFPLRVFCRSDCKGLCSQCGQALNSGPCACSNEEKDERWAALADLKFS